MQPILNYTLYGKPTKVFPFPPNWKSQVTETIEWKTDVLRAFSGAEQRRKLRQVPRRSFEYSILVGGEMASMLEAYLWNWQHRYFALPVWTDIGKLTSGVTASQTSLPLATDMLSFQAGDYVVVFANPKSFEVVQIDTVFSDHLTLVTGVLSGWPTGTKVYPLIVGHLGVTVPTSRHNSSAMSVSSISFLGAPEVTYPFLPTGVAPMIYDGYEVVTHAPNWDNTLANDFSRMFDTVDSGVGAVGYFDREVLSRITKPIPWMLKSRAEIVEFRKLAGRLSGQHKTCWLPSWNDDFKLASGNSANQLILTVKGIWFNGLGGVDLNRDRLAITLPNGQMVFRKITSMAPNYSTDTTELQLDSVLGTTVGVYDNIRLRLLMRCRLATDKIVIPWRTDGVATPTTTFTTVKL